MFSYFEFFIWLRSVLEMGKSMLSVPMTCAVVPYPHDKERKKKQNKTKTNQKQTNKKTRGKWDVFRGGRGTGGGGGCRKPDPVSNHSAHKKYTVS